MCCLSAEGICMYCVEYVCGMGCVWSSCLELTPFGTSVSSSCYFQSISSLSKVLRALLADGSQFPKELEGCLTPLVVLDNRAPGHQLLHTSCLPMFGWELTSRDIGSHTHVLKPPLHVTGAQAHNGTRHQPGLQTAQQF